MKILGQQPPGAKELTTGQTKSNEPAKDTNKDSVGTLRGNESVKTTPFILNKIRNKISAEPEVRADRVAELKTQIKSGKYQVDAQKIAGKMITDSLREDV